MSQKVVFIAGFIGLVFGFLFAGTFGIDFFGSNDNNDNANDDMVVGELDKDEEAFRLAYNLDSSIYIPITGDQAYQKIEDDDSFILYIGRHTCPFCQQFIPVLQEAAINQGLDELYHVDSIDDLNEDFVSMEGIRTTPTTYIVVNGEIVEELYGYQPLADMKQLIIDYFS